MHPLWHFVFGNDHPVEVEIGPGTGTFLLGAAARSPHVNFFGIEHSHPRAARLSAAIEADGVRNARTIAGDASCVVAALVPPGSVSAYHIYFPDPWWKRRHHRRRLFTPAFGDALEQTLVPGGRIYVATDVPDVFSLALQTLTARNLARTHESPPPRPRVSAFEGKGVARGATISEVTFIKCAPADSPRIHTNSAAPITPAESPS
jgi:tRNA (guanine-N7-)-methyltransferase